MARRWSRHNYGYLRHLIERSLEARPGFGARVEVEDKIEPITEGLWHQNYRFWIQGRKSQAASDAKQLGFEPASFRPRPVLAVVHQQPEPKK